MAGVGGRFDLEAARAEARAAKKKAKIRAIVSNAVSLLVLLAIAGGGWIGWNKWQEKREAERIAAEQAAAEERQKEAERKKAEEAKRKAREAQREAERKAREAQREAEKRAREEKREAERLAREEERRRKEEERRYAAEHRAEQEELKSFAEREVGGTRFDIEDHLACEYGIDDIVDASVDGERWNMLASYAAKSHTIEFFEELRGTNVTNNFSELRYPDRSTVAALMENLNKERFTLVLRLKDEARGKRLTLVAPDLEKGLAEPDEVRELKVGSRVTGWTAPFNFGDKNPFFLLNKTTADRFSREWTSNRRKLMREAAKLDNRDEYVNNRMEKMLPDFLRSIQIEISTPPPEDPKKVSRKRDDEKDRPRKATLKGSNSSIRTMAGPRSVR